MEHSHPLRRGVGRRQQPGSWFEGCCGAGKHHVGGGGKRCKSRRAGLIRPGRAGVFNALTCRDIGLCVLNGHPGLGNGAPPTAFIGYVDRSSMCDVQPIASGADHKVRVVGRGSIRPLRDGS